MKTLFKFILFLVPAGMLLSSCEGPMGLSGTDANETCKECHNSDVVEQKAGEFHFSKHGYGEVYFEESGNKGCSPCHTGLAFKYVVANNIPSTFTLNATTSKYANDYATDDSHSFGPIDCFTCHDKLHSTYTAADFKPVTTTAAVAMTMWKGAKTIDLTQDGGTSNLCVKCHQPRPLTTSSSTSNGDVVDYASLASSPAAIFYDNSVGNAAPNKVIPSYRTHVHYGTVGAIYAGKGGVEFTGTQTYSNSIHTTTASCGDCHMSPITGKAGGHTFFAKGNFTGCNVEGCHTAAITSNSTTYWKTTRTEIQTLLNTLATKINAVGGATPILHAQKDAEENLWAGLTTAGYDGYLNIYDPSTNPTGVWRNPNPGGSWTVDQKATNLALPLFPTLKNVTMGAMINFQLALREYSLGIHNYKYTKALLQNSIEALTAQGY